MTLIVPVYNGAHVLPKTLAAVLAQDVGRIVYVDDGSVDATPRLLADLASRDDRVRVLTFESNRGRAAARNAGAREAEGDTLLFVDADVVPDPRWATTCCREMERKGGIAALGSLQFGDLDPADPYHQYLASSVRGPRRPLPGPIEWRYFVTTAVAVRREAFEGAGGFPEAVGYGEDLALACRLSGLAPDGLVYVPTARATMYDPGDLGTALEKVRQFAESLPEMMRHCPDVLRVGHLSRLPSQRLADRVLLAAVKAQTPARALESTLPRLPRLLRPIAVRYLLAHAFAVHAHNALTRAS
ncbi:MAG: glycosyltransferase [Bacteroidota bacterium]